LLIAADGAGAEWLAQQIVEAFPDTAPTYLVRDNDGAYVGCVVTANHNSRRRPWLTKGMDTRRLQHYLGHASITNTVRYTAMSPEPFKDIWRD
jgi:hypothetical protein